MSYGSTYTTPCVVYNIIELAGIKINMDVSTYSPVKMTLNSTYFFEQDIVPEKSHRDGKKEHITYDQLFGF